MEAKVLDQRRHAIYPTKTIWRIRVTLPDDLHGRAVLHQALADQAVCALRLLPRDSGRAEMTGELMIEAAEGEALGTLLGSLHIISPQVFVTRADLSPSPAATRGASFSARAAPGRPVSA